ncbi:glycosyltransferase family 39 protein [Alteraurantiacibacter aquimixticola]|uniref:Polyprenol-phosphate-mannose--protein mannosyltransferase n=1 Tax=Alteraurantiacibacter aquimixticola TaxID=2489173 RepID=A0A4T3F094_9SPHN|nr:glycosyltransferase family 39 protein [Alteraurantiacibacter aquimixticola]TIX50462.1 phospholipid carrier-dependent glycosyltransferase [Alteraurantiacibacter aquimixticola]
MQDPPIHETDPWRWHLALAAIFAALCANRLTIPSQPFFDEVHYLPAVRYLLDLSHATNLEHPPFAKQVIALGVAIFGDNPLGWRIMPLLFGVLALFSSMRAMWFATENRAASVLTGMYIASGFMLLVQARIAMLDIVMAGFMLLALWMCAGAVRENETARWRLAIAGVALGCAMASKWNAIPLAMVPGLTFLVARLWAGRRRPFRSERGWPIRGMSLMEASVWLGVVPLATYAVTYWPFLFFDQVPGNPSGLIALHMQMLDLQQQTLDPHPYQSRWWQWVSNTRAIWYLYEQADGAQRGVLLLGNPLSSLAALPALVWCIWAAWKDKRRDCAAVVVLYAVSLGMWLIAPKPVQFFYHYLLPHCFAMAALALATERLRQRGERLVPWALLGGSLALFSYFYPILTAARLSGEYSFLVWAWLEGWR